MSTTATLNTRTHTQTIDLTSTGAITLLARLLYVPMFLLALPSHFSAPVIGYASAAHVPFASFLVPASGVLAGAAGLSVLVGYRAKLGAWLAIAFLIPVTLMMHNFWTVSDPMMHQLQFVNFMKNVALIGAALLLTQFGAGPWSLDARQK